MNPAKFVPKKFRKACLQGLKEHFARIDEKLKDVSPEELDSAVDEAIRSVRPRYRPIR
jgi:hypothetical protein